MKVNRIFVIAIMSLISSTALASGIETLPSGVYNASVGGAYVPITPKSEEVPVIINFENVPGYHQCSGVASASADKAGKVLAVLRTVECKDHDGAIITFAVNGVVNQFHGRVIDSSTAKSIRAKSVGAGGDTEFKATLKSEVAPVFEITPNSKVLVNLSVSAVTEKKAADTSEDALKEQIEILYGLESSLPHVFNVMSDLAGFYPKPIIDTSAFIAAMGASADNGDDELVCLGKLYPSLIKLSYAHPDQYEILMASAKFSAVKACDLGQYIKDSSVLLSQFDNNK